MKILCEDAIRFGIQFSSLSFFWLLLFQLIASYKSPLGPVGEKIKLW